MSSVPVEPLFFNGEEVTKVDKYVYPGLEFNKELNINIMSKYRQDKSKSCIKSLIPTLKILECH